MPTILPLRSATTALALTVPTCWADVPLAQFVALFAPEPTDTRRPAEVLCGLPAGYLDNLAVDDVAYLANLLQFSQDPADVLALLPTPGLPDIGSLPYGVLLLAEQAFAANPERPWLATAPRLLALYRTQLAYGSPLNMTKVEACEAALLAAPVTESYADAAFFLTQYKQRTSGTPPTPTMPASPKTKNTRRGWKKWASALARCFTWTRRPAAAS